MGHTATSRLGTTQTIMSPVHIEEKRVMPYLDQKSRDNSPHEGRKSSLKKSNEAATN